MLTGQTLAEIARDLPSLGSDLAGPYGDALQRGVHQALEHFLSLLGADVAALDPELTELYLSFGVREERHGRSLDTLLAAYRRGARSAWTHFAAAAVAADVPTGQLVRLAEAIFAYIEELSSASTVGFARSTLAGAGQRDAVRQRLARAILGGEADTAVARVADLSAEAAWPMPERLGVALLPGGGLSPLPIIHPDILVVIHDSDALAVVPDGLVHGRATLERLFGSVEEVYVGTVRPAQEAPISLSHARSLHQLVVEGVLDRAPVVRAADHLPDLLLHADRRLLADLTAEALAPLEAVPAGRRETLAQTLRAWLGHQGDRVLTANELGVHPQTVSYRMAQLEGAFADGLRDPRSRFALLLALEGRHARRAK
ncbi:MAG TPA: helix-turn-helix domain-containing protein [Candidatus Lustribacter sp.]|nr:helix-turn-helix domain-containing protein [Candidatus Lustribacter sp.]